jgi:act minimal PKS chain-length factor (CLF/KS beta)
MTGGRVSTSGQPGAAYLPFDLRACGYVPAEGGAILILEDAGTARRRCAPRVYGTVAGYAATFDPAPDSGRVSTLRRAMENALMDAGLSPGQVDVVFADAAATPDLDQVEADAIAAVFGERAVPVTAPKTMTGRMYAGAGAVDVAAALLAIRDGVIPPTANVRPARRYPIDLVTGGPRRQPVGVAMVVARGHGGFNSALVVSGRPEEQGSAHPRGT